MIHKKHCSSWEGSKEEYSLSLQDMDILTGETDLQILQGGCIGPSWNIGDQMNEGSAFHPVPCSLWSMFLTFFADLRVEG